MGIYAGMDVSDKTTHLCVVDGDGVVLRRDVVGSDPELRGQVRYPRISALLSYTLAFCHLAQAPQFDLPHCGAPVELHAR